jgi:hypothetical protein
MQHVWQLSSAGGISQTTCRAKTMLTADHILRQFAISNVMIAIFIDHL